MAPDSGVATVTVRRVDSSADDVINNDVLAVEEPLEIRLGLRENGRLKHRAISITMRTPGADPELAAGFLFTEGIIDDLRQVTKIRHCGLSGKNKDLQNTVIVELDDTVEIDFKRLERNFYTTSSCGVCGKSSIEALHTGVDRIAETDTKFSSDIIHALPDTLREQQDVFEHTGGLHASALFDAEGNLDIVREDVGRHNALDKVIGAKLLNGETPLSDSILLVSGRASFELVQKALMAGIPVMAAVGAPSSLAVELADEYGMTLVGFVRDRRFNIYTGHHRIA